MSSNSRNNPPMELYPLDFDLENLSSLSSFELALVCFHLHATPEQIHQSRVEFLRRRALSLERRAEVVVPPAFTLLVKILLLLESRRIMFPTPGEVSYLRMTYPEYKLSKIATNGYRNHLEKAEKEGIIRQGKGSKGEWLRLESRYRSSTVYDSEFKTDANFHKRDLTFPLDTSNLTVLTSEQLILSQFKSEISLDLERRLIELFWKRKGTALERGFSWRKEVPQAYPLLPTPPSSRHYSDYNYGQRSRTRRGENHNRPQNGFQTSPSVPPKNFPNNTQPRPRPHPLPVKPLPVPTPAQTITISNPFESRVPLRVLETLFQLYLEFPGGTPALPPSVATVEAQQALFKVYNSVGWTSYHTANKARFYVAFETPTLRNTAEYFFRSRFDAGVIIEKGGTKDLWCFDDFEDSFAVKWGVRVEEDSSSTNEDQGMEDGEGKRTRDEDEDTEAVIEGELRSKLLSRRNQKGEEGSKKNKSPTPREEEEVEPVATPHVEQELEEVLPTAAKEKSIELEVEVPILKEVTEKEVVEMEVVEEEVIEKEVVEKEVLVEKEVVEEEAIVEKVIEKEVILDQKVKESNPADVNTSSMEVEEELTPITAPQILLPLDDQQISSPIESHQSRTFSPSASLVSRLPKPSLSSNDRFDRLFNPNPRNNSEQKQFDEIIIEETPSPRENRTSEENLLLLAKEEVEEEFRMIIEGRKKIEESEIEFNYESDSSDVILVGKNWRKSTIGGGAGGNWSAIKVKVEPMDDDELEY